MFKDFSLCGGNSLEDRVLAFVFFLSFPLAIPWIVKTADYKTSPVVQSRFKVGLAILALTIIATAFEYVLRSHDSNILKVIYMITGIPVASLVLTELILMHCWKRELNDFRWACPTNATSSYCDRLYRKMKCNATSVFPINRTVIVNGESVNQTVFENIFTPDTCYNKAREWMEYGRMFWWGYPYLIGSLLASTMLFCYGTDATCKLCENGSSQPEPVDTTLTAPINVTADVDNVTADVDNVTADVEAIEPLIAEPEPYVEEEVDPGEL